MSISDVEITQCTFLAVTSNVTYFYEICQNLKTSTLVLQLSTLLSAILTIVP